MAKNRPTYRKGQLLSRAPRPPLTSRHLDEVAFPLGGIGTGMIALGGWGQLRDWEIRNRPAKGYCVPESFFMLKAGNGADAVTRVLQGPVGGTHTNDGHSARRDAGQTLPHFREVSFTGRFPTASVELRDPAVPLDVELEAFNPFIPLNDDDSSIPVAILLYRFTNTGEEAVEATVFGNLTNVIGEKDAVERVNRAKRAGGIRGLYLATEEEPERPDLGSMALATTWEDTQVWPRWKDPAIAKYWEATAEADDFPPRAKGTCDTGTIAARFRLEAGETVTIPFFIAWHFPVVEHWHKPEGKPAATWRNYYASLWRDAWDVAAYTAKHLERLHRETVLFRDTLFGSTLPTQVLDAISSQISILKSPACLRLPDGTFYGFEGCSNYCGCCEGTCTHVWNYAQALPYLFPALQRSVREAEWANSMQDDGYVTFRMPLPLGTKGGARFHPAADGQMGTVMQVYREWLISGDDHWLRRMWPKTKKALEFAWKYWDADKDGVMEGMQHNTYDIEFYGPNTITGSLYLGALRAAELMAERLGEKRKASEYKALRERGAAWTDEHLFNGEYYEQEVRPGGHLAWPAVQREAAERAGMDDRFPTWPKWQFGKGCMSDQLIGQWYAEMLGLGNLYDREHVRATLQAIFRNNWRADLSDHVCRLRIYAFNDEAGLLVGTWPRGERPGHAMYYSDEVWCGMEYEVASHLIYEGMVQEGLTIVKAARDRYTGERRNPWDEIECGHHYSRSMSSYALLLALSGFSYSAAEERMAFAPRLFEDDFACFFSVGSGWGVYRQKARKNGWRVKVETRYGSLTLRELDVAGVPAARAEAAMADGTPAPRVKVEATAEGDGVRLVFAEPVTIKAGDALKVSLR